MCPPETIRHTAGSLRFAPGGMRLQKYGVDVSFQVIHADQRLTERLRQHLAVRDSHQQRADQPRPVRDGHRVQIAQLHMRLLDRFADHGNDLPQMLARGQLRHHAAVLAVNLGLRRDHARKDPPAAGHDRRRGLVARRFDTENQALVQMLVRTFVCGHTHASILTAAQNRYVSIGKKARLVAGEPFPEK